MRIPQRLYVDFVIASAAKQSIGSKEEWIASLRSQ
jgi:hypothetical protein